MDIELFFEICKFITTIGAVIGVLAKAYKSFTKTIQDQVTTATQIQTKQYKNIQDHLVELDKGAAKREESLKEMNENIAAIKNEVGDIKQDLKENTLQTYRDCLFNENFSKEERIEIGRKYLDLGGNGVGKKMVEKLEDEVYQEKMGIHVVHGTHHNRGDKFE